MGSTLNPFESKKNTEYTNPFSGSKNKIIQPIAFKVPIVNPSFDYSKPGVGNFTALNKRLGVGDLTTPIVSKFVPSTEPIKPVKLSLLSRIGNAISEDSKIIDKRLQEQGYDKSPLPVKLFAKTMGTLFDWRDRNPFMDRLQQTAAATIMPDTYKDKELANAGKIGNFVSDLGGSLMGLAVAGQTNPTGILGNINKLGAGATSKLAPSLGKTALQGGVEGALFGGTQATNEAFQGATDKELLNTIGLNALMGGALGGGVNLLGKGLKGGLNKLGELRKPITATEMPINNTPTIKNNILNANGVLKPVVKNNLTTEMPKIKNSLQNPSIGANDRTQLMTQVVSSEVKEPFNFKKALNKMYTRSVDSMNPLKDIDETTYRLATNSKSVGGTVDHIIEKNLVNMKGDNVGESLKTVVRDIPKGEEDSFINYVLQKHNIDRAREGKSLDSSFTSEESMKAVTLLEQQFPQYKQLANRLVKFVNTFEGEWANKSGLVKDDLWTELQAMYKNYIPTQRSFSKLEQGVKATNEKGFTDQGNTLKKATGSDRDIINPIENIMNLVNKTVRTARYNEVGQSFVSALEKNPKLSKLAEIIPKSEVINPNVNNVVSVLVKGEPVNIRVNNQDLLETLQGLYKNPNTNVVEQTAKKLTSVFKQLITQKNPVFAVRNIARDIPTFLINTTENNPIKAVGNLLGATKDVLTSNKNLQKYKAVGGGGGNFFDSAKPYNTVKELKGDIPLPKKIGKRLIGGIEKFNTATETIPRLAEFNSVLKKTGDTQKALFAANDVTTNFSRSGDVTKTLDAYVPYLNASVQGLDKLARQLKNRPIQTVLKGTTAISGPTLVLNYINQDNPNYKELDNRTKDTYFLFPNPSDNGKTFIKIPKAREFGVLFGSLLERTLRATQGDKEAFKGMGGLKGTLATNFSPANPLENNLLSPLYNLKANKDFANRDIVPKSMVMDGRSPYLQYDEKTTEPAKKLAELARKYNVDLSPKQIDYIVRSYTGVLAQLGQPLAIKTTNGLTVDKALKPITSQFISDPLYSNQNITDFYDNMDKVIKASSDNNLNNRLASELLTPQENMKTRFTKASTQINNINKEIKIANANGDLEKVKELRRSIVDIAKKTNDLLNPTETEKKIMLLEDKLSAQTGETALKTKTMNEEISNALKNKETTTDIFIKYKIPYADRANILKSAKEKINNAYKSPLQQKYDAMSKANRAKFYNSLTAEEKLLIKK